MFFISWRLEAQDETVADVMSLEDLVIPRHMSAEVVPFIHWFSLIRNNASPFHDGREKAPSLHTITLVTNFQCVNVWKDKSSTK